MKKLNVVINSIHDASQFVNMASKVEGDVICSRGKYVIDGKSALGIFSIDISEGMVVEYPEDAVEFEKYIMQFAV